MGRKKKFTEEIYQEIKDQNSKDNPLNINNFDKQSILNWLKKRKPKSIKLYLLFNCEDCNNQAIKILNRDGLKLTRLLYCKLCNQKYTSLQHYGTEYAFQSSKVKQKIEATNLRKYGKRCYTQTERYQKQAKKTNLKRLGVEHPAQSKEIQDKTKQTNLKRYGVEYTFQAESIKEKIKETCLERYGTEFANQNENVKNKIKETCLEKYGVDNPAKSDIVKLKVKKTNLKNHKGKWHTQTKEFRKQCESTSLKNYGVRHPLQKKEILDKQKETFIQKYGSIQKRRVFYYNNVYLESSWELCFYVYHSDKNHTIIREPKPMYYYVGKIERVYYPDFKIGNKYYEIKGEQFIVRYKNGNVKDLKNPYTKSKKIQKDYHEKFKCMKRNKVKLITKYEIQKYIDYVLDTYGLNFFEKYVVKPKTKNKED